MSTETKAIGGARVCRSNAPLLRIRDLAVSIGDTPVLHAVSLSVRRGEIVGLLGPNGAGKTTTMTAALGLLPGQSGETRLFDQDPRTAGPVIRRRVGVLPDPQGFYDWMTARDYLVFFAHLYGSPLTPRATAGLLDRVGLAPHRGQPIGTFSHGMRQRLGLARALVPDPELLLLDEPANGLDPQGRRTIHDILVRLAGQGVGILLCTHLLDDVERLCHRIALIVAGRTVVEGRIADLLHAHAFDRRFRLRLAGGLPPGPATHTAVIARQDDWIVVDVDPAVSPDAAWRELLFLGWPITEIVAQGGGLEGLYLTLAGRPASLREDA